MSVPLALPHNLYYFCIPFDSKASETAQFNSQSCRQSSSQNTVIQKTIGMVDSALKFGEDFYEARGLQLQNKEEEKSMSH